MPKNKTPDLPEAIFHAIATVIQRLVYIVEKECGIAPIDLLTLWYIDYFGVNDGEGRSIILRRQLTRMLTIKFRISDAQITKMLDDLQDQGLVERTNMDRADRKRIFGHEDGPRLVVVLTERGSQKFDLFKERMLVRYERWLATLKQPTRTVVRRVILPIAVQCARWIIARYDPVVLASVGAAAAETSDT
ncbi:MAG TPA: hypothetical protein VN841_01565 [Bryobacteraceae bacterium]|nr:hypothetical protein [Bryobacteraceae bacterium]